MTGALPEEVENAGHQSDAESKGNHVIGIAGCARQVSENVMRNTAMQPKRKASLSAGLRTPRGFVGRHEVPLWFTGIAVARREIALR